MFRSLGSIAPLLSTRQLLQRSSHFGSKLAPIAGATVEISRRCQSSVAYNRPKNKRGNYVVTLIAGDGIGPEISEAVVNVFQAAKVWDYTLSIVGSITGSITGSRPLLLDFYHWMSIAYTYRLLSSY